MVLPVVENAYAERGTVFVIDRDDFTRRKVSSVAQSAGLKVAIVESAAEFFEHYNSQMPGCIVLNIHEPSEDADAAYAEVTSLNLGLRTIFVAGDSEIPLAIHAACIFGHDLLYKPFSEQELAKRIQAAMLHDRDDRKRLAQIKELEQRIKSLTPREFCVMKRLADGDSVKTIASALAISPKTVDKHRAKILDKMRVDNPTQLAQLLLRFSQ